MTIGNEGFEQRHPTEDNPELVAFLAANQDINPAHVLSLDFVPPLIGGIKSNRFIIKDPRAGPDTPPNPGSRIDLKKMVVASNQLQDFGVFFTAAERQANNQYDIALIETQQVLADAAEQGNPVDILFIPDVVNASATSYFTRLTRLAQDTGIPVAMLQVDHDYGDVYRSFIRFEPIRATSVDDYWQERSNALSYSLDPILCLGNYSAYSMEEAYQKGPELTVETLDSIILPTTKEPLIIQRKLQNEHDNLQNTMRAMARASTSELRELLINVDGSQHDKVAVIREIADSSDDNICEARIILAKLGDKANAQMILREISNCTEGRSGYESLTTMPLGIHLRHDEELFTTVLEEVQNSIATKVESSKELLPLLGALFHSHDQRVGELLANYLVAPTQNTAAYASKVLHAIIRWMPEYAISMAYQPRSAQRDRSFQAIEARTADFLDAHNKGQLDAFNRHIPYSPDELLPLLLWFSKSTQHGQIVTDCVMRQFKNGGSVITDPTFERTYLHYRRQYGDLPDISQLIRTK